MIRITDLSKTYTIGDETVHALDGANLHVRQRQIHADEHHRLSGHRRQRGIPA